MSVAQAILVYGIVNNYKIHRKTLQIVMVSKTADSPEIPTD